jgi:hypothetical protein
MTMKRTTATKTTKADSDSYAINILDDDWGDRDVEVKRMLKQLKESEC